MMPERSDSPPPVLVLQHIACEPAAAYQDVLERRGLETVAVHVDEGEPLPDWREFSAIVAMGGPMSIYEDATFPWVTHELRLISDAVRAGTPFWGVCLGAQLLAAALGARVAPSAAPEIGVLPVDLSDHAVNDPVFGGAPEQFLAFHWHSDTYDLPAGATHLASSQATSQQAFALDHAYGLQFHLEVSPELAELWSDVPEYAQSLRVALGADALESVLFEIKTHAHSMIALAEGLMTRWLDSAIFARSSVVGSAR